MKQLSLWSPEELPLPSIPSNLKSPSACRAFSLALRRIGLSSLPQPPACIRKTASKDAAHLRMQLWASKTAGRNTSGKSEMVPVGEKGDRLGQYHHRAVWTDAEIDEVFALADQGLTVSAIARKMEMPRSTVWAVVHGFLRGKTPSGWRRRNV